MFSLTCRGYTIALPLFFGAVRVRHLCIYASVLSRETSLILLEVIESEVCDLCPAFLIYGPLFQTATVYGVAVIVY